MTDIVLSRMPERVDWRSRAEAIDHGAAEVEIIKGQCGSALVGRVAFESSASVIVKIWYRCGLRGSLRRLSLTDQAAREWSMLHRLTRLGLHVPRPLAFCRLTRPHWRSADVIFMQDVGRCETAMRYLNRMVESGADHEIDRCQAEIIDLVLRLIRNRIIDTDCIVQNFLVKQDGTLMRNDFEMMKVVACPMLCTHALGEMIGRLIASFAFATQPRTDRAAHFAHCLAATLSLPRGVLRHANQCLNRHLQRQREESGIDTRLILGWNEAT